MVATPLTPHPALFVTNAGAPWSGRCSPSSPPSVLPGQFAAPLRSSCPSSPSCGIARGSGRGGPRARHARASARRRRRWTWRCGTRTCLLYPAPSPNPFAEVLEKALEVGMLAGDARPLPPPDALSVAALSLSTLSHAVVMVQIAAPSGSEWIQESS
ncbi:uncharacterized protein LOC119342122 isoform X1 [Triticum dicoccoides]|uniref:uncharacterized protein LOC119342122 isoform X1 n=1 Tax=Triticum dicoccoides TaxID=85692 RepID=UPI001891CDDB|nr:uncharacterized protein LOC119342122 isoform X1 [Triticum dicoccoides]